MEDLSWATVFINPNTGKVIDICFFSYFYDYVGGASNLLSYREDFLALFQKLDVKKGLAKDIIVGLMNRSNGFWEKTRELWPDED